MELWNNNSIKHEKTAPELGTSPIGRRNKRPLRPKRKGTLRKPKLSRKRRKKTNDYRRRELCERLPQCTVCNDSVLPSLGSLLMTARRMFYNCGRSRRRA